MRDRVAHSVVGAAGVIAALTLLSRVVGFGRYLVFAESVRSGGVGGIYNAVNAIPNVLYEVAAGGVLAAVAVPLIGAALGAARLEEAHHVASVLFTWTLTVLVPIALVVLLAAPWLAAFVVPDTVPGGREVGTTLLRIFAVQIPLYGAGIVLSGVLQAHRRFVAVAAAPLLSSVVVVATYLGYGALATGRTDPTAVPARAIEVLGWGTTAGVVALSVPLLGPALRTGWRPRVALRLDGGVGRRLAQLATAGVIALAAQQLATVVIVRLSRTTGDPGTFTVYGYLQAVYVLPYAVLAVPVAMSVFPSLAQASGATRDAAPLLARALRAVVTLTGVAVGSLMAVAGPVGAFFTALDARRGGAPSTEALAALPQALTSWAPGLVGFSVSAVLVRALYVRGRPIAAALAVAAGWLISALGPLVQLSADSGATSTLRTLGLWSSAGMTVAAVLLLVLVRRSWGSGATVGLLRSGGASVVAAAGALLCGDLVARSTHWGLAGGRLGSAVLEGAVTGAVAAGAGLAVLLVADRGTLADAVRRGRAARGESRP